MARLLRVTPAGIPLHIIQRGVNKRKCFLSEKDYQVYIRWLKDYSKKYKVSIHAWVLMTNHVHLLCTPQTNNAVSKMMQSIGRQYVRYFNYKYGRTGTLWEGRFKSCLVQSQDYLMELYKYIELNPVRAGIVKQPEDYKWSSYHANALGKNTDLCTPHELYLSLGYEIADRCKYYRSIIRSGLNEDLIDDIRQSINQGTVFGNEVFQSNAEILAGTQLSRKYSHSV